MNVDVIVVLLTVAIVLVVVWSIRPEVVCIIVPVDNSDIDIEDIVVVVDERGCCVAVLVVDSTVSGHVRGTQ